MQLELSDERARAVRDLHRRATGHAPDDFDEALETVVRLAEQSVGDESWDPGSSAGSAFKRVLGEGIMGNQASAESPRGLISRKSMLDPDRQAIFKTRLDEEYSITVPDAEARAVGMTPGEIVQIIAYPANASTGQTDRQGDGTGQTR